MNVSGSVFGSQYSGGVAGENRGVIETAKVTLQDDLFRKSQYVTAGVVGLNLGGLVIDVNAEANIVKTDYA